MPFTYGDPPDDGSLRQGEILRNVIEYQPTATTSPIPIQPLTHPLVVAMTNGCDLEREFEARGGGSASPSAHVLLCDLHDEVVMRPRFTGSKLWKRVRQNQDERYHRLDGLAEAEDGDAEDGLYMDFRAAFSQPLSIVYSEIQEGTACRTAVVPPVYLQDLLHRFYSYLSRVALPD